MIDPSTHVSEEALTEVDITTSRSSPERKPRILSEMSPVYFMYFMLGVALAAPMSFATVLFVRNFSASQVVLMYGVIYIPWMLKPIIATWIDTSNHDKVMFMHISLPLALATWILCLVFETDTFFIVTLACVSGFTAVADVALDSMMIERVHIPIYRMKSDWADGEFSSVQLQAKTACSRTLGAAIGAYVGGQAFGAEQNYHVFFVFISGVYLVFWAGSWLLYERFWIQEIRQSSEVVALNDVKHQLEEEEDVACDVEAVVPAGVEEDTRMLPREDDTARLTGFSSAWGEIKGNRTVQGVLTFTFFLHAMPRCAQLIDTFLVDDLHFDSVILGTMEMMSNIGAFCGASLYELLLRRRKVCCWHPTPRGVLRFMLFVVGIELVTIIPALVFGTYRDFGITAKTWAVFVGFLRSVTSQVMMTPIQGSIVQFCRGKSATTLYALFTAVSNSASIVSIALSSALAELLGIQKGNMIGIWKISLIRAFFSFVFIYFAKVIPNPDVMTKGHSSTVEKNAQ